MAGRALLFRRGRSRGHLCLLHHAAGASDGVYKPLPVIDVPVRYALEIIENVYLPLHEQVVKRLRGRDFAPISRRANIQLENYTKIINIEALTLLEMAKQDIIPAVSDYVAELCTNVAAKQAVNDSIPCNTERNIIMQLAEANDKLSVLIAKLEDILGSIVMEEVVPASQAMAHKVVPVMEEMRIVIDGMEKITSSEYWPYPTYFDLLYSVK